MFNTNYLYRKFSELIDEIFIAVAHEQISTDSNLFKAAATAKKIMSEGKTRYINNFPKKRKSRNIMLQHCKYVIQDILKNKNNFTEACKKRANDKGVDFSTVYQACLRSLGLNAETWRRMVCGEIDSTKIIKERIISKYPEEKEQIDNIFSDIKGSNHRDNE